MKFQLSSIKNRFKSMAAEIIKKIVIVHRLDYDKFPVYLHDNIRLASCRKEPGTIKWIEGFKKTDVVFDIGANVGAYSLIMAHYAQKVFAVEPSVFTFGTLIKNIHTNKASNIIPLNIALSQKSELLNFAYSSVELGSSSHGLEGTVLNEAFKQSILAFSLDNLVDEFNIGVVHHVKLDVDGIEFEILKGARKVLGNPGFKSLSVEVNCPDQKELVDYLEGLGLRKISESTSGGAALNYLFIK